MFSEGSELGLCGGAFGGDGVDFSVLGVIALDPKVVGGLGEGGCLWGGFCGGRGHCSRKDCWRPVDGVLGRGRRSVKTCCGRCGVRWGS